ICQRHGSHVDLSSRSDLKSWLTETISAKLREPDPEAILPADNSALILHMSAVYDLFDREYYSQNNNDLIYSKMDPLVHYCTIGWKNLQRPNPDIDLWWYWSEHLDQKHELIDPLLHYAVLG